MDGLDDGLAHSNDLDATWGFDLDEFLQERAQPAPAAGEAGDGTAETMGSSQRGALDALSVPAGRAEGDPGAASASYTSQGNGEDPPAVLSGQHTSSAATGGSSRQYGAGPGVKTNAWTVNLLCTS